MERGEANRSRPFSNPARPGLHSHGPGVTNRQITSSVRVSIEPFKALSGETLYELDFCVIYSSVSS